MKKLERNLTKNKFNYQLVERTDSTAIYSQHTEDGTILAYEAFVIKVRNPVKIYDKEYPEMEMFPSNEDFGKTAWSCSTLERARKKLK